MPGTDLIALQVGDRIRDVFLVEEKLGQGGFGAVYKVLDQRDHKHYAMKTESRTMRQQILQMEVHVLDRLLHRVNFCTVRDRGRYADFNFVVMTLVGASLQECRKKRVRQRFTPPTALRVGNQTLCAISHLHSIGFLHRDIKPANFAIGRPENGQQRLVFLLDFGMCRKFLDDRSGEVRPPRRSVPFKGTVRYASLNCHLNREQARRDDLESWWYMQVEMSNGALPWRMEKDKDKVLDYKKAVTMDESAGGSSEMRLKTIGVASACYGAILKHITGVKYESIPDYNYIKNELQAAFNQLPRSPLMDAPYDWEKEEAAKSTVVSMLAGGDRQHQQHQHQQQQAALAAGSRDVTKDPLAPVDAGGGHHKKAGSAKTHSMRKMPLLPRPGVPRGAQLSLRARQTPGGGGGTGAAAAGSSVKVNAGGSPKAMVAKLLSKKQKQPDGGDAAAGGGGASRLHAAPAVFTPAPPAHKRGGKSDGKKAGGKAK